MRFAFYRYVAPAILAVAPLYAADELPKGEALLDKFIEVTGGKAAHLKVRSEITTGYMEFGAMQIKGKLTVYRAEPALAYTEMVIDGVGTVQDGSDGKVAWSLSAMQGARLKQGEEKAASLLEAKMHHETNWRDHYSKAETTGMETVDGKECFKVLVTPKEGSVQTRYYDKQSGLFIKSVRTLKSPMGEITAETIMSDYRKDGDLLSPRKVVSKVAGQEVKMTVETVQFNVDIPKEKFELPEEIKALVAKEPK